MTSLSDGKLFWSIPYDKWENKYRALITKNLDSYNQYKIVLHHNAFRPQQIDRHFADFVFKCFFDESYCNSNCSEIHSKGAK